MQRRTSYRGLALALAAIVALTAGAGCIANQGTDHRLSATDGAGDIVVYLVLEDGELTISEAWWAKDAPDPELVVSDEVPRWQAMIVKNDVTVDRMPVVGSPDEAFVLWDSAEAGILAQPGDTFEVLVVDQDTGQTKATFGLDIET